MKKQWNIILYIVLFVFAGLVIFKACIQSNQAVPAMPMQIKFAGEYSQAGGEWQELREDTDLSAFDGDLSLRGRFDEGLPEGVNICFYLDHIGMNVSLNGEEIYEMSNEINSDMCGTGWQEWLLPAMAEGDMVLIQLHNPHCYGNRDAYNELLDSLYLSGEPILKIYYEKEEMPYRYFCAFILVVSIALVGTAIGYQLLHLPNSILLLKLGIMSLLMGVYMYMDMDTKDIFLRNNQIVFNTYALQISMMLAAFMLGTGITELLHEKRKQLARITGYVLMLADMVLMAVSFAGVMGIYDTGIYWAVVQGIVSLTLLVLGIMEIKRSERQEQIMLISAGVLSITLMAELLNGRMSWWQSGICIKSVFGALFVSMLLWAVKLVAVNYQAAIRAKKMEEELNDSQMALAMSQIQPHFIYNSLNSIYHLCDKDIEIAQQAISDFSDYLQRSLSAVSCKTLISFEEELKHVKTYLKLEQIRFGKDLHVEYHIEANGFRLPVLSVQPLVENAVKHGICQKEEGGGTVILEVKEYPAHYEITVSDDGVGFISGEENNIQGSNRKGSHVGIRNVRHRLDILCHGTLEVKSELGKGTTSRICIPKEKET